jgi:lipoyl(octanoyl) transferase
MRSPHGIDGAVILRRLGLADYEGVFDAMRRFTATRDASTPDELWLTEHPPVYTVGAAGREEHLPRGHTDIPVKHIDRGGQITYHGPGQVVVYTLIDLQRRGLKVRAWVDSLEQAVIDLLATYNVRAERKSGAPGVYVNGAKIAALGLRVKRNGCYHGVSLNVDMDLTPFDLIDPCGYPGLRVTQTRDLGITATSTELGEALLERIAQALEPAHG